MHFSIKPKTIYTEKSDLAKPLYSCDILYIFIRSFGQIFFCIKRKTFKNGICRFLKNTYGDTYQSRTTNGNEKRNVRHGEL